MPCQFRGSYKDVLGAHPLPLDLKATSLFYEQAGEGVSLLMVHFQTLTSHIAASQQAWSGFFGQEGSRRFSTVCGYDKMGQHTVF